MKLFVIFSFLMTIPACASVAKEKGVNSIFQGYEIINFGEYHGTKEMPKKFFDLVKEYARSHQGKSVALGLEIPKTEEVFIRKLIETGDEVHLKRSKFFNIEYQDGRASRALVNSLKDLKDIKNLVVFCFDEEQPYSSNRDKIMADNILAAFGKYNLTKVFTFSGNLHPRKKIGTPWDEYFKSMGVFLSEMSNRSTLAIRGEFSGGSSWNCSGMTTESCGIKKVGNIDSGEDKAPGLRLLETRQNGYDAILHIEKVTASPPWNQTVR